METTILKKRVILYLAILYGFLCLGWLVAVILPEPYHQTAYTVLWGLVQRAARHRNHPDAGHHPG